MIRNFAFGLAILFLTTATVSGPQMKGQPSIKRNVRVVMAQRVRANRQSKRRPSKDPRWTRDK